MKNLDREELHKMFYDFSRNNQIENFYLVGIDGNIAFDIDNLSSEPGNRLFIRELGVKILAHYSGSIDDSYADEPDSISGGFMDQVIKKTGILHQIVWPGSSARKFVYTDIMQLNDGKNLAVIAILDKAEVDRNYLKASITNQYKINPDHEIIIINKHDISDTIPKMVPTFKANLLPMLSTALISNSVETDQITDGRKNLLVALYQGNNITDFLIGARASWSKIVESIRQMYLLVFIGLLFSLSASIVLITALLREFLTPISILSSGAKAISKGDLDLNLPVFAKDELGELSTTFNTMTRRLKNRLTELTVLYNMTQKASTSHNQREVFDLAAENLVNHLKGETQGTAWINVGEGEDSVYLAEHHSESEDEAIRSCVKMALRSFKTHVEHDQNLKKFILAIPLFFEEKKFGAIYVLFNQDRFADKPSFSEDEKSFIETLRHHLSLIIEKQRLFEQAITDGLTKLYVRRFFLATLEKELARSKRYQLDVAILLLDIDHFKKFNDTFGHQAGDFVLRETAQRVIECIRAVDTPGRYGGEEMAVILPQTNIKEAFIVADRIKKAIENAEYDYRDHSMKVTVSIGVSSLHDRQVTVEELIDEADRALYVAKEKGRNQVRIAPEAM
jgi:diguanylate cyclase (GGDEF)-like protein